MLGIEEIDLSNWRRALDVQVRDDQVRFVADHQPVALVILSKCYVRPDGYEWTPYLALDDSEAVGVAAVASDGEHAYLRHVAIDYRRQGAGLGRKMIVGVVAEVARAQPRCRGVFVTTHPENEVALSLYASLGFRPTGAIVGIEPVLKLDIVGGRPSA
jgi:diamine N-acetyltransferase